MVIPVKNESGILGRCLESLKGIDYPARRFEIIISDGMSADDTKKTALSYGARVVPNEGELVASGRNRGFEASCGEIVAFTDADCVFDKGWLRNSIKYFNDEAVGGVGGAVLTPEESTDFEKAADCIFNLAEFFNATAHRKNQARLLEASDIPGCSAIYRRKALEAVMPVDEGLLTAEDVWMNFHIRRSGYRLILAPDVILRHYRRSSPGRLLRQAYRFAVGRAQVSKRNPKLLGALHIMTGLAIPVLLAGAASIWITGWIGPSLKMAAGLLIALIALSFLKTRSLRTALDIPLAFVIFTLGWSAGFLRELFFPMKEVKGR